MTAKNTTKSRIASCQDDRRKHSFRLGNQNYRKPSLSSPKLRPNREHSMRNPRPAPEIPFTPAPGVKGYPPVKIIPVPSDKSEIKRVPTWPDVSEACINPVEHDFSASQHYRQSRPKSRHYLVGKKLSKKFSATLSTISEKSSPRQKPVGSPRTNKKPTSTWMDVKASTQLHPSVKRFSRKRRIVAPIKSGNSQYIKQRPVVSRDKELPRLPHEALLAEAFNCISTLEQRSAEYEMRLRAHESLDQTTEVRPHTRKEASRTSRKEVGRLLEAKDKPYDSRYRTTMPNRESSLMLIPIRMTNPKYDGTLNDDLLPMSSSINSDREVKGQDFSDLSTVDRPLLELPVAEELQAEAGAGRPLDSPVRSTSRMMLKHNGSSRRNGNGKDKK